MIDHNHIENCSCGCGDNHEKYHSEGSAKYYVNTVKHDQAVVGSYFFEIIKLESDSCDRKIQEILLNIEKKVLERGGHIGHIKATATKEIVNRYSATGNGCMDCTVIKTTQCKAEGVAIVFGIETDMFEIILNDTMEQFFNK